MQDPSQYVLNQMEALEAEQNHVDNRAGVVERKLRQLLETGKLSQRLTVSYDQQYVEEILSSDGSSDLFHQWL